MKAAAEREPGGGGLCFLGCGAATRMHARTLRKLAPELPLHFASRNPERAAAFAREHGGAGSFGSYPAAFESSAVAYVLVATPPSSHLELVSGALEAGKDVIVEKPAFPRSRDFDPVDALRRRTGRQVLVAENYYYKPLARRLRALLREEAVGRPLFLAVNALKRQASSGWRDDLSLAGGGALFEGGIHWVNFVAHLGPRVRSVHGTRADARAGPERGMQLALSFEGGAAGVLLYSWEIPSPLKGLRVSRIYGSEGSIAFESNGLWLAVWGRKKRIILPGLRDISGYRAMFADFLRVLRRGGEPAMTFEMARRDVEIVEEAYRTAGIPGTVSAETAADTGAPDDPVVEAGGTTRRGDPRSREGQA